MPDHCCSAAFCLTEITVPSQPQTSFNMTPRAPPTPSLILHKFSLFRQPPPARSYPHAQYSFSSPQPFSQHPLCTSHLLSKRSIPSILALIPYPLPAILHPPALLSQPSPPSDPVPSSPPLTLPRPLFQVPPPQDATIDHCPNSIPPFQDAPKCLQRDGPSPYTSQKRA
ncbi:hypothetical protein PAPYR_12448 [Paratrimastix pyriformis]|uniref:Uncharacterized protein n=1 Tax=Paratrimastix pyriformis TaxID=342808 RepID=A0ABQ8U8L0_9EUKA|nr:hypothetical protein PAPYR_12448 [Paratrimastix pyriformis]